MIELRVTQCYIGDGETTTATKFCFLFSAGDVVAAAAAAVAGWVLEQEIAASFGNDIYPHRQWIITYFVFSGKTYLALLCVCYQLKEHAEEIVWWKEITKSMCVCIEHTLFASVSTFQLLSIKKKKKEKEESLNGVQLIETNHMAVNQKYFV